MGAITGVLHNSLDEVSGSTVVITVLLLGGTIGLVEFVLLSAYVSGMVWWIPATSIGWTVGGILTYLLGVSNASGGGVVSAIVMGASISLPQYAAFRRRIPSN